MYINKNTTITGSAKLRIRRAQPGTKPNTKSCYDSLQATDFRVRYTSATGFCSRAFSCPRQPAEVPLLFFRTDLQENEIVCGTRPWHTNADVELWIGCAHGLLPSRTALTTPTRIFPKPTNIGRKSCWLISLLIPWLKKTVVLYEEYHPNKLVRN